MLSTSGENKAREPDGGSGFMPMKSLRDLQTESRGYKRGKDMQCGGSDKILRFIQRLTTVSLLMGNMVRDFMPAA